MNVEVSWPENVDAEKVGDVDHVDLRIGCAAGKESAVRGIDLHRRAGQHDRQQTRSRGANSFPIEIHSRVEEGLVRRDIDQRVAFRMDAVGMGKEADLELITVGNEVRVHHLDGSASRARTLDVRRRLHARGNVSRRAHVGAHRHDVRGENHSAACSP
jgi:hypothetical protein